MLHASPSPLTPLAQGIYTPDLVALDGCRPRGEAGQHPTAMRITTPLNARAWRAALSSHPDTRFATYIINGMSDGFRVGFAHPHPLRSATRNCPSADAHPQVVTSYIEREVSLGRFLGPFSHTDAPPCTHLSKFAVIPKGHTPGKWRLITDLSSPKGQSVNDGIAPPICSLRYVTVDEIATIAAGLGRRALIAKLDVESAYRIVPVHPDDCPLLGVQWQGAIYVDAMLPFGLRSAPKIFTAIADALEWVLRRRGVRYVWHYIDDFVFCGPPSSTECGHALDTALTACRELGVPIAAHKVDGPATGITVLGIQVNTITQTLSLPQDKLRRLQQLLSTWGDKRACTRRELQSLLGLRNHACKVVRPGRSFLRRMLNLLRQAEASTAPCAHHFIRLNAGFRADLQWWRTFVVSGMECPSSQTVGPSISRWSRTPRARGAAVRTRIPTGSSSSGWLAPNHSPSLLKSSSQLLWRWPCGARHGPNLGCDVTVTICRSCTTSTLARVGTPT